jgi:ComF family protein
MQYSQWRNACQPRIRSWVDRGRRALAQLLYPSTCILCRGPGQIDGPPSASSQALLARPTHDAIAPEPSGLGGQSGARPFAPSEAGLVWSKRDASVLGPSELRAVRAALDLCAACEAELPANRSACQRCAEPLSATSKSLVCGACLQRPSLFDATYAPFRYAYPLDHLIQGLKFRREIAAGRVLGQLFARSLIRSRRDALPELIVPVPLARGRYRERGYNQACELALPIVELTGIALRSDLVARRRETQEQTTLDRSRRRRNVRGAFVSLAPLPAQHVAILDDVITTGSTVAELAKVLRHAGAQHIEVWAIARAGREVP